ncbi:YaiI/YqxD family protein [Nitratiruptor tergarcus]|uniref:UPF0178 protein SAMN05660197_0971 n=1 Tax=Nitratiruptor tergarcus DSM 16512 TaxID=1069081 RepID=A0A1W1WS93_9BACT|nr:YaiI/YqxD family protein [Nitratiruptor tergarcus]SMC09167.1 hypothetical protein SAMN05660197_0971 [Nitratiruptor tergarcus DSM 16512]
MRLFIDADALPNMLKPLLLKAITRYTIPTYIVSNKPVSIGSSPFIQSIIVDQGIDKADLWIIEQVEPEDLVITADIPLADKVVAKGAWALDHRGILYDPENIKHYLALRNLMQTIRDTGEKTKGPASFSPKDKQAFANALSKFLAKHITH